MTKHDALRKQRIIDYIASTVRESGYPPSVREIAAAVGLASTSAVHHHLSALEKEGLRREWVKAAVAETGTTFCAAATKGTSNNAASRQHERISAPVQSASVGFGCFGSRPNMSM